MAVRRAQGGGHPAGGAAWQKLGGATPAGPGGGRRGRAGRPGGGGGAGGGVGGAMEVDAAPAFSFTEKARDRATLRMSRRKKRRSMMEIATTWTPAAYDRTAAHWHLTPSEVSGGSILSRPPQPAPPAVLS